MKRFTIYDDDVKSALDLMKKLGNTTNEVIDNLDNKTDKRGNHEGTWQGLKRPTMSEEGMRATVEKLIDEDIPNINTDISQVDTYAKSIANIPLTDLQSYINNNDVINLARKTYTITKPLVITRKNIIKANNAKIIADFDNWEGTDYTALKIVIDDVPTNVLYVLENLMREISNIEIIGKGTTNKICTAIEVNTTKTVTIADTPNFSFMGKISDIYIRNFDTALRLKECWNTNFSNIHVRNVRQFLSIEGKVVNVFFNHLQVSNFTKSYTQSTEPTYGIRVNSGFHYSDGEGRPEGIVFSDSLIFGAEYDVYILRALFMKFNSCILDGATKNAVYITSTMPQGLTFDKCYFYTGDRASGSSIIRVAPSSVKNAPITIINSHFIGQKDGEDVTNYGIYFEDGGVSRESCVFENNRFEVVNKAFNLVMCPSNSSIKNNNAECYKEMIYIQNSGSKTIVDGNRKMNDGYVVRCYGQSGVPSGDIDIRQNSSPTHQTYKRGKVTLAAGQTSVAISNNFYSEEIGLRTVSNVTPNKKCNFYVTQNANWSNGAIFIDSASSDDITFEYETKTTII